MSKRRSPSYSVPIGSPPSAVLISCVDVVDVDVVARAQRAVGLDHELRLRSFLLDVDVDGAAALGCSSSTVCAAKVQQHVGVGARELDGQVGRRAVGVLGDAVDDRLREVEARRGELVAQPRAAGRRPAPASCVNCVHCVARLRADHHLQAAGRKRIGAAVVAAGLHGDELDVGELAGRSRGCACRTSAVCWSDVPSGKLARTQITPSSMYGQELDAEPRHDDDQDTRRAEHRRTPATTASGAAAALGGRRRRAGRNQRSSGFSHS